MAPVILLPNEGARIRSTCVMLGLRAFQSFRSIPRSLSIFSRGWIPHFTSIINWALRYGLALLLKPHRLAEPWLALVDTTFTFGSQILFAVLSTPLVALKDRGSALTLEDVHCIGLEVTDTLTREKIAEILNKVFSKTGIPVAIIEDWSSEIHAGAKLWNGKLKDQNVELIRDVGHAA
ncbi:MAG: hypothetical protein ABI041_02160, partial [Bdellovibrionia bacterium]